MKYVVFSDVHGNIYALQALLRALKNRSVDGFLYCGDTAGYYYHPGEAAKIISSLPNIYAVKGNHDKLYCRALSDTVQQKYAIQKYGNAYKTLSSDVADIFESLPEQIEIMIGKNRIALAHGVPLTPDGRIYPDSNLSLNLDAWDFFFFGHTHYRMQRTYGRCRAINPGSLGQPRDGKGFSYCIVDFNTGEVEFYTVEYDLSSLLREIEQYDRSSIYLASILTRKSES